MGWEFQGDNLVYKAPAEVAGYTWVPMGQNENGTNPEGTWVKNEGFDPSSLTNGSVDKYGRVNNSLKSDATEAEKRAYALTFGGANPNSEALEGSNAGNTNENLAWWNVDPALEERAQAAHRASGGNAVGMSGFKDWIVPLSILAGGAGAAIGGGALAGEAALGLGAGEAAPLTTAELLNSGFAGSNFAIDPLATYGAGFAAEAAPVVSEAAPISLPSLDWTAPQIGASAPTSSTFGTLDAALPSAGSVGGAGTGLSAELAPNAVLGTGLNGGEIGGSYLAGANGSVATDFLGNAIPASSVGMGGTEAGAGSALTDTLKDVNQARQGLSTASNIAKLLGAVTAGTTAAKAATGATNNTGGLNLSQLASLLAPKTQTNDFLGQYKMNQNPFLFTPQGQTVASEGMYDVSGSNPMANALRKA